MATAAEELGGLTLPGKWKVLRQLPKKPNESGGYFSVGYIVENEDGRRGFLKALDYARLLSQADPATVLAAQTNAFNFEREILRLCRARRMDRIVEILDEGSVIPPGRGATEVVQYLIFELADGDARRQADETKKYDGAWALRTLHDVTVGLRQLHRELIAHQDLKPSNVLVFGKQETKLGDLGRASTQHVQAPHEDAQIAGDHTYAPPEALYRSISSDWVARRIGCDQYLLGSLICSFFLGSAITPLVQERLNPDHKVANWGGDYDEVLPYLRQATDDVILSLQAQLPVRLGKKMHAEIISCVRQLCDPDCGLRGHPADRRGGRNSRSLERYVSVFDRLSREAAIALRPAA